eukprot:GEMP01007175.1.p1 GENE.GEMP01007175.1~~GEMP01007175.1.p1  ORF type:complete len:991 (+),score=206.64 GEMP01007175.1:241-3213(+)
MYLDDTVLATSEGIASVRGGLKYDPRIEGHVQFDSTLPFDEAQEEPEERVCEALHLMGTLCLLVPNCTLTERAAYVFSLLPGSPYNADSAFLLATKMIEGFSKISAIPVASICTFTLEDIHDVITETPRKDTESTKQTKATKPRTSAMENTFPLGYTDSPTTDATSNSDQQLAAANAKITEVMRVREETDKKELRKIEAQKKFDTNIYELLRQIVKRMGLLTKSKSLSLETWSSVIDSQSQFNSFPTDSLLLGRFRVVKCGDLRRRRRMLQVEDEIHRTKLTVTISVPSSLDPDDADTVLFLREAVLLNRVGHPNLMRVNLFGSTSTFHYMMMDYHEGQLLEDFLNRCRRKKVPRSYRQNEERSGRSSNGDPVPEMHIIEMLLDMCDVLHYTHDLNVMHTAINSHSIWLGGPPTRPFEAFKLLDWHMAEFSPKSLFGNSESVPLLELSPKEPNIRQNSSKDSSNKSMRTAHATGIHFDPAIEVDGMEKYLGERDVHFISPERAAAVLGTATSPYTASYACDIYSLGCVAYECASLWSPYQKASSLISVMEMLLSKDDPERLVLKRVADLDCQLDDIRDGRLTSDDFLDIVEKMLDKKNRYKSVNPLIEDLKKLYGDLQSLPQAMHNSLAHLRYQKKLEISGEQKEEEANQSECLDLSGGDRTDFISRYLAKFASALTVDRICITSGVIPLSVIRNPETRDLRLNCRNFASHDVMVLARTFSALSELETLDLSENFIAYENTHPQNPRNYNYAGFEKLADAISCIQGIRHLDFSANSLGSRGGEILCSGIQQCLRLQTLRLAWCELMPSGGVALAGILHKMPHLLLLDVSYCYIGDIGSSKLVMAINDVPSLQALSLFANSISDEGGGAIMKVMDEYNFSLLHLSLGENPGIPAHQISIISQSLAFNNNYRALKEKNLEYDLFGHNLMLESLTRWARNDAFVAKRLLRCLAQAKEPMEQKVLERIVGPDGKLNLKSILDFKLPTAGTAERT